MIENGFDCKVVNVLNQNCIELLQRKKLTSDPLFESGLFEIQDIGSQCIAPFLNPKSNTTVIDACSGAGGKALHIASMMNKTGNIIALDIHKNKLVELSARAKRQGVGHIQTHLATGDMLDQYKAKADYLLLDVPCTGVGTLKRQADLKYKINESFIAEKNSEQQKILQNYSAMLSPNGEMVYATCSLFPSENEEIINQFLKANVNFEMVESNYIRPSEHKSDGFFMAKMKKR
jgi:16S rRNA (cytosine967-C5)-methyltransferase